MVDNSWINEDRKPKGSFQSKMMKTKVIVTIAILVIAAVGTICLNGLGSNATQYRSQGIAIDFGNYYTIWVDVDYNVNDDPVSMLEDAKKQYVISNFDYRIEGGKLVEIDFDNNQYINKDDQSWGLWYVEKGGMDLVKSDSYSIKASDYTVVVWAFTVNNATPMTAVDATGTSIYGYSVPDRVVSLSPVCTETINSVGGIQTVVGTDAYSDYPELIVERQKAGTVAIVGSYTDPSYEAIMNTSPDMVFCDASTYNDVQMAGLLRSSNVNSVVLYNGEDINTIVKNIFITGTAMGFGLGSQAYIQKIVYSVEQIKERIGTGGGLRTMVALSNDPSPWVSGSHTYINDIVDQVNGTNVYSDVIGWTNITAESILQKNPECIIIVDGSKYSQDRYDDMIRILSNEWKSTDAYKNGKIYLLADDAGKLGGRAGPRFVQLMELMGMMIDPSAYIDDPLPVSIGNDYRDYLEITGRMG